MKAASIQKEIIDNYFNQLQHYGYTNINKSQQVLFAVLLLDAFDMFSDMLDVQFEKDVRRIMRKLECCMCELPLGIVDGSVEGESYTQGWWELVTPTYSAEMMLALQKEIDKKVDRDELAKVAFSGDYDDLENTPEINDATLTFTKDGQTIGTFTANSKTPTTIDVTGGGLLDVVISYDQSTETYSADHTIREIIEAYEAGKVVTAHIDTNVSEIYTFAGYYPYDNVQFYYSTNTENGKCIEIYEDGEQETVDVTRLSSPAARITFTQGGVTKGSFTVNQWANATIALDAGAGVQSDWSQSDSTALDYIKNKPTIGEGQLTIQKNATTVGTFSANAVSDTTIDITVPTQASDINALPDSTKYGSTISVSIDDEYTPVDNPTGNPSEQKWYERSGTAPNYVYTLTTDTSVQSGKTYYTGPTYVVTTTLKDQDGNTLGSAQTIDLPLESVVVSGYYDDNTKKVVLTLKDGSTVEFSVADLVSGLQTEITASNKLSADLVDDSTATNKFATAAQLTKLDNLQNITTIGSNLTLTNGTLSATDTTYNNFTGADGTNAGAAGLVPAPATTDNTKFLKGDGTWATVVSGTQANWTQSDPTQLDYIQNKPIINSTLTRDVTTTPTTYTLTNLDDVVTNGIYQVMITDGDYGGNCTAFLQIRTGQYPGVSYVYQYLYTFDFSHKLGGSDFLYRMGSQPTGLSITWGSWTEMQLIPTVGNATITVTQGGVTKGTFTTNQSSDATIALDSGGSNVQADWNQTDAAADDYIKNKPTIPTVNDGVLTITQDGVSKGTFSANQAGNQTIALVSGITYIDHTGD